MTRKGSGLSNQRAWEIWKILGERSKGEYPLGLFKPPKKDKIDPGLSDEKREEIRLRGVPRKPRKADKTALLARIEEDKAHADATLQAETERTQKLKAEMADYEADPAPMINRLQVFMACMVYHNFALEERIDAEVDQREFRSGIPGVSDNELRSLIRSHWQAVTKRCGEQHGADFKEIVDWMRERIRGISEEDVKRTADEAIRRGYAEETSFDVIYDYQRRYDIRPAGLAFVHDNDLMSKDARFEGLSVEQPEATTDGAVNLLAQRVGELLRRHDVIKESCGLEETLSTVSQVMSEIRELVPDLATASVEKMEEIVGRLDEFGQGLTKTGLGSDDWIRGIRNAIAEELQRIGMARIASVRTSVQAEAAPPYCFRLVGDIWKIRFEDEEGEFRSIMGFQHIATLLSNPGQVIASTELSAKRGDLRAVTSSQQPVLDEKAKQEYREMIAECEREIEQGERNHDLSLIDRAREEKKQLMAALRQASGFRGKTRELQAGNLARRAHDSVRKAIDRAINKLAESKPPLNGLVQHLLRNLIPEGGSYVYRPSPVPDWNIE